MDNEMIELDARGLNCPLPILRLKKALNELDSGDVVRMLATDPGSVKDSQSFCSTTGNVLLSTQQQDNMFVIEVRKQ